MPKRTPPVSEGVSSIPLVKDSLRGKDQEGIELVLQMRVGSQVILFCYALAAIKAMLPMSQTISSYVDEHEHILKLGFQGTSTSRRRSSC